MSQARLVRLAAATLTAGALALAWWGWQMADAGMLLLGMRLC
ncbi:MULTISPECIES: hypothetical protein [Halomonadaceae]|nr:MULTISPECIES: hypothetical protein [Halomonas]